MQYDIGKKAIESSAQYVNAQLERVNYGRLRKYFDVDNTYIAQKMRLMLFPFWNENPALYRPDLYVPIMSFTTLLLLKCFVLGLGNRFHPEALCLSFTRHLCFHGLLVLAYKLAAYLCGAPLAPLDLAAFAGYKFFAALVARLAHLLPAGRVLFVYPFVAFFFFLARSLKSQLLSEDSHRRYIYLLFGIVASELLLALFIAQ